jgi:hypothetical protein
VGDRRIVRHGDARSLCYRSWRCSKSGHYGVRHDYRRTFILESVHVQKQSLIVGIKWAHPWSYSEGGSVMGESTKQAARSTGDDIELLVRALQFPQGLSV